MTRNTHDSSGEEAIVRLLLHFGADPTIPDAQGGKPLEVRLRAFVRACMSDDGWMV